MKIIISSGTHAGQTSTVWKEWRQAGHRYVRNPAGFADSDKLRWLIQTREVWGGRGLRELEPLCLSLCVGINLFCDSGLDHNLTPWPKVKLLLLPLLPPPSSSQPGPPASLSASSTGESITSPCFFSLALLLSYFFLLFSFLSSRRSYKSLSFSSPFILASHPLLSFFFSLPPNLSSHFWSFHFLFSALKSSHFLPSPLSS